MTKVAVSVGQGEVAAQLSGRLQAVVQQALAEQRLVGAVVLVARAGEPLYAQAAGWADREQARPMALDAVFRLASVSKPIVSVAALVLVAQGRLALEAEVARWLPEFQPRLADGQPARITVRQLLSHTAGLGYRFFEADAAGPYARAGVSDGMDASGISLDENLRRLAGVPLLYAPGTAWGYSLATDVLGALVARVQGTSLAEAVRQLVTGPVGMVDTGFVARDPQRVATAYVNGALPHPLAEGEVVPVVDGTVGIVYSPARVFDATAFPSGGAGMAGTAGDFLQLLEVLRQGGGALLPAALVAEMGRDQTGGHVLPMAPGFGFGLGCSVLRDPALAASPESPGTWRWGGAYGHAWFMDRARALSVVAFTNTLYEGMSGRFVTDVRDAVYGALEGGVMRARATERASEKAASEKRMTAVAFQLGSTLATPESLVDIDAPCPIPGPHDLRVAVRAVSVNPLDTKVRAGLVKVPEAVRSLGWDAAGVVEAVGEAVTLFRPGQAVYYAGSFDRTGSNAQYHLVDERIVGHKPATLSFADAAALPLTALTAWQLLFERLGVTPGKPAGAGSLLVLGGAGGVGSMLIQLARRLTGLTVIATAGREASRAWCLALGAHHVIDHRQPLAAQLSALPVPPVTHIAALSQTAEHWQELAAVIAPQGRVAIIDDHDSLDATPFKAKSVSLHWEMVFTRPLYGTPDLVAQHRILDEVAALVDAGVLRSTARQVLYPLDAARLIEAHRLVESGGMVGKVVVARSVADTLTPAMGSDPCLEP